MIDRERALVASKDSYELLKNWEEPIFKTTQEWLESGEIRYPYLIWDEDQWTGSVSLNRLEFRSNGEPYIKSMVIFE